MLEKPTVTVFGSCRVHTPCTLLRNAGRVSMNQKNIFGYTHYTSEILQQFALISGGKAPPQRLRPYLNIPDYWQEPPRRADSHEAFHEAFADTDLFVVEVSSVRRLLFKAVYLQINRVRELLVGEDEKLLRQWWNPLVRSGDNNAIRQGINWPTPLQQEIGPVIESSEQGVEELVADMRRIKTYLRKPVLFVSHFNTDYKGVSIPQRQLIIDAMRVMMGDGHCGFYDPSLDVLTAGLETSIQDLGHYKVAFEPLIADRLHAQMELLLRAASKPATKHKAAVLPADISV